MDRAGYPLRDHMSSMIGRPLSTPPSPGPLWCPVRPIEIPYRHSNFPAPGSLLPGDGISRSYTMRVSEQTMSSPDTCRGQKWISKYSTLG